MLLLLTTARASLSSSGTLYTCQDLESLSRARRHRLSSFVYKGEHCLTFSYLTRVGNSCSPREYLVSLTYINTELALEHGSRTRDDLAYRFYFHPLRNNLKNFFFFGGIFFNFNLIIDKIMIEFYDLFQFVMDK